ncbi:hypothetical protein C8F01DRAFT_1138760 [Mycena amicta]|nr:hypothetical protein C8F01DRAFT_1138760 [Mycena amicta]
MDRLLALNARRPDAGATWSLLARPSLLLLFFLALFWIWWTMKVLVGWFWTRDWLEDMVRGRSWRLDILVRHCGECWWEGYLGFCTALVAGRRSWFSCSWSMHAVARA